MTTSVTRRTRPAVRKVGPIPSTTGRGGEAVEYADSAPVAGRVDASRGDLHASREEPCSRRATAVVRCGWRPAAGRPFSGATARVRGNARAATETLLD